MARVFYVNDIWKNLRTILKADASLIAVLTNEEVYTSPDFDKMRPDGSKLNLAVSPADSGAELEPDETDDDMICHLARAGIAGIDIGKTRYCPTDFIIAGKHYVSYKSGVDPEVWVDQITTHEQRIFEVLNENDALGDYTKHLGWSVSGVERVDPIGRDVQNGYIEIRFIIVLTINVIFKKRD